MADAVPQAWPPEAYGSAAGCPAFTPGLLRVRWPVRFRPALPLRYDSDADPEEFLQLYAQAIQAAGGNDKAMVNWLPWPSRRPLDLVSTASRMRRSPLGRPHAVACIIGGSQAPGSGRHVKQFFR
jgi:hypothetical protein